MGSTGCPTACSRFFSCVVFRGDGLALAQLCASGCAQWRSFVPPRDDTGERQPYDMGRAMHGDRRPARRE